jgi:predicted RNA-binding protein
MRRRTPDQCRSHHQKLQIKYSDDLYAIMNEVQRKIQKGIAEEFVDKQHRLHTQGLHMLRRSERGSEVIEGGWFEIRRHGNTIKVCIDSRYIGSW